MAKKPTNAQIALALHEFREHLKFGNRCDDGSVVPGYYWPKVFRFLDETKRLTAGDYDPMNEAPTPLQQIGDLVADINRVIVSEPFFGELPLPSKYVKKFDEYFTKFCGTLSKKTHASIREKGLNIAATIEESRSAKPLIHEAHEVQPKKYRHGPIHTTQEALGFALRPERDLVTANSFKLLYDTLAEESRLDNSPVWIRKTTGKKIDVYFQTASQLKTNEALIAQYPGRKNLPKG